MPKNSVDVTESQVETLNVPKKLTLTDLQQTEQGFEAIIDTKGKEALKLVDTEKGREILQKIITDGKDQLRKIVEEITFHEGEMITIREGVDFSKCQMDRIIDAYKKGERVEFETFSPYLADYNMKTGEIWANNLTKSDAIGIVIGKMLREKFIKARIISLYDEYNSGLPDSTDPSGKPTAEGSQLTFFPEAKEKFKENVKKIMRKNGLIEEGDKEDKNFLLISESSKVKEAEELVDRLEQNGNIKRDGEAIYFVNPKAENPEYAKITLRAKNGRWLCEALDASTYLKPENLEITHLVVLSNHFKKQQDKVWEVLHVLGIEPTNYHNIFYDENTSPETVTRVIQEEIEKY